MWIDESELPNKLLAVKSLPANRGNNDPGQLSLRGSTCKSCIICCIRRRL
uniref:Uncharacterized protein n=1 Tax=Hyaloperonospora arabidopsidis (strain Emoy2) TaxID=559515 RepID=M4B9P4_HYAAE